MSGRRKEKSGANRVLGLSAPRLTRSRCGGRGKSVKGVGEREPKKRKKGVKKGEKEGRGGGSGDKALRMKEL